MDGEEGGGFDDGNELRELQACCRRGGKNRIQTDGQYYLAIGIGQRIVTVEGGFDDIVGGGFQWTIPAISNERRILNPLSAVVLLQMIFIGIPHGLLYHQYLSEWIEPTASTDLRSLIIQPNALRQIPRGVGGFIGVRMRGGAYTVALVNNCIRLVFISFHSPLFRHQDGVVLGAVFFSFQPIPALPKT